MDLVTPFRGNAVIRVVAVTAHRNDDRPDVRQLPHAARRFGSSVDGRPRRGRWRRSANSRSIMLHAISRSRTRWSLDRVGLTTLDLIARFGDDRFARKRGKNIFGVGAHHDPLLSRRVGASVNGEQLGCPRSDPAAAVPAGACLLLADPVSPVSLPSLQKSREAPRPAVSHAAGSRARAAETARRKPAGKPSLALGSLA